MADVGLRDLGSFIPGGRAATPGGRSPEGRSNEPIAPPLSRTEARGEPLITPPPVRVPQRTVFGGDHAMGTDALGIDATLDPLAELAAHKGTATPLCIGLLGGPGTGKSFALGRLVAHINAIATAAGTTQGPFLSRVHVQSIDAASLPGDDLATGLAAALHAGLGKSYRDLAREIGHAARDPHVMLRETNEKLDEARHRLDSERRALDDAGSRRARLVETVLYEAAGSQVDAYARANRAGIEARLHSFGILGDPIRSYKDFVQFVAGSGGTVGLALRSLWGFRGQAKLIVTAIVLVAIGIGFGIAIEDQGRWLAWLRTGPQAGVSVAAWLEANPAVFALAQKAAFGLAGLAVIANLYRAFAFLQPIVKGARLLSNDLDSRRRDLDGLYAHQTKRVDALDSDVERLTRASAEAEKRIGSHGVASEPSPFAASAPSQAQSVFDTLSRMMAGAPIQAPPIQAPQRIIIALDHLDGLAPERARAILDTLHRLAGPGLLTIVTADPARLAIGGRDALDRWIQIPVKFDGASQGRAEPDHAAIIRQALGHAVSSPATTRTIDASRSVLDQPVSEDEANHLAALSPLAGRSPRAIKRFVNLYTLARLGDDKPETVALMLAVLSGGTETEKNAVRNAIGGDPAAPFDLSAASPRLQAGLSAVSADGPIDTGTADRAYRRATLYIL